MTSPWCLIKENFVFGNYVANEETQRRTNQFRLGWTCKDQFSFDCKKFALLRSTLTCTYCTWVHQSNQWESVLQDRTTHTWSCWHFLADFHFFFTRSCLRNKLPSTFFVDLTVNLFQWYQRVRKFRRESGKTCLHLLASVLSLFTCCRLCPSLLRLEGQKLSLEWSGNAYSPRKDGLLPASQAPLLLSCLFVLPVPSSTRVNLSHVNTFCWLKNKSLGWEKEAISPARFLMH